MKKQEPQCKSCGQGEIRYPRGLCRPCFEESLTKRLQKLFSKGPRRLPPGK